MTNLTLGFVTRLLLTALILKAAPAASQQAGQLSRKLPGGGSSSCTTALVTTTADCLEVAGIDLSGVNGGQYPDPSEVSCSRDCNKKSIAGCTEDDVASGASYLFKNVQDACDYFVDTCGEVTIDDPVDPGFGVEPSFDFNHCTTMYTGDNHDSCTITEGVEVFNSMSTFSSCSGWSGWEVIQTLIDGEASFGSLITECGDLDEVRRRYREAKRGRSSVTLTPAHNALTLFATPPPLRRSRLPLRTAFMRSTMLPRMKATLCTVTSPIFTTTRTSTAAATRISWGRCPAAPTVSLEVTQSTPMTLSWHPALWVNSARSSPPPVRR